MPGTTLTLPLRHMVRRLGGRSRLVRYVLVVPLAAGLATCDGESTPAGSDGDASPTPRQTLFETLEADGRFDTLVGLVRTDVGPCCEGFEGVLGATTLTVFAPPTTRSTPFPKARWTR